MNLTLVSLLPFLVLTYLLLIQKVSAAKTMLAVYALTAGLLYFFWQADLHLLLGASLKGLVIGLELFLIIIGVMLLFFLLKHTGKLDDLERFFQKPIPPMNAFMSSSSAGSLSPFWKVWPDSAPPPPSPRPCW